MRRILPLGLVLLVLVGVASSEEEQRYPAAAADALVDLEIELAQIGAGPTTETLAPPYGLVALAAGGRFLHSVTPALESGLTEEDVGELEWGRAYVLLRHVRGDVRKATRRLSLGSWSGESDLPVIVAVDRRVPWARFVLLLQALEKAGIRRFLLAAVQGEPRQPVLVPYDLPRTATLYGGYGRTRTHVSVGLIAALGEKEDEVLRRVVITGCPTLEMGEDPLAAAEEVGEQLAAHLDTPDPSDVGAVPPWRVGKLWTDPPACSAVTCGHVLPLAAALLRAGLDDARLSIGTLGRCIQPPRSPYASFAAYEADVRKRRERPRPVLETDWLETHQTADGSWRHTGPDDVRHDVAVTALAALCFLERDMAESGAHPWNEVVHRALTWLRSVQAENGSFAVPGGPTGAAAELGQALATLAVVQAWRLRPDPTLERGVHTALDALPAPRGSEAEVTTADLVALLARRVARLANEDAAKRSLKPRFGLPQGAFASRVPDPRPQGWQKTASTEALIHEVLCRLASGARSGTDWELRLFAKALLIRAPTWTEERSGVDALTWWLGTLAVSETSGMPWKIWNEALYQLFIGRDPIRKDGSARDVCGSWDPVGVRANELGRVGMTAAMELMQVIYFCL